MDNMIRIDKDYIEWLKHVKKRFKNTQIKASIKVMTSCLGFTGQSARISLTCRLKANGAVLFLKL